jgi:hypothetical protein
MSGLAFAESIVKEVGEGGKRRWRMRCAIALWLQGRVELMQVSYSASWVFTEAVFLVFWTLDTYGITLVNAEFRASIF